MIPYHDNYSNLASGTDSRVPDVQTLVEACRKLVDYRNQSGLLNFQLEKADTYIRQMEELLDNFSIPAAKVVSDFELLKWFLLQDEDTQRAVYAELDTTFPVSNSSETTRYCVKMNLISDAYRAWLKSKL